MHTCFRSKQGILPSAGGCLRVFSLFVRASFHL